MLDLVSIEQKSDSPTSLVHIDNELDLNHHWWHRIARFSIIVILVLDFVSPVEFVRLEMIPWVALLKMLITGLDLDKSAHLGFCYSRGYNRWHHHDSMR
jgi:hypothetical protein